MTWIIMPVLSAPDLTEAAIADCLGQSVPTRLLIVNQGVDDAFRRRLERIAEEYPDRVFLWSHQPPLPSLAASWNRALDFVWECGGAEALVINNDVRLHPRTLGILWLVRHWEKALFVSCVGVTAEQFDPQAEQDANVWATACEQGALEKGGPDFSCFLISADCHARFRFDEAFVPAYCEDLDYHRRLLLAGEGARIFSINLPFLHYGAGTLKAVDPIVRTQIEGGIARGSRAYYARKWGGPVNEETFVLPFHQTENRDVSTPALQRMVQEDRAHELPRVDPVWLGGMGSYDPATRA